MLLLRAAFLEFLICFHVLGAAVLFRRLFPRESPWLGFFVPILAVMFVFNFAEHFIPLTCLGWLLPFTMVGLFWSMIRPGCAWEGLRLPGILFLCIFTLAFIIKCLNPSITCNTEGTADYARVLDFCLGDKLPPTDCWCPPYDHGGYYTFQHYGASLLTRLFSLDVGTGYNLSFALLNTLTVMAGAGVAHAISGRRMWVCLATTLLLVANFTGSAPILLLTHLPGPDAVFRLSIDLNQDWNDPNLNPFSSFLKHDAFHPVLRLFTPTFNFWFPEYHANLGGHFMTLACLLMACEVFRVERSNWPWIGLVLLPAATIITSTWFFIIVFVFSFGALLVALFSSRRPQNVKFVLLATAAGLVMIWPSVGYLMQVGSPLALIWTHWDSRTSIDVFLIQWWPVYVPWLFLCFIWLRLDALGRFIHLAIPALLLWVEYVTIGDDRGLTVEKMWGGIYGAGLVTLWPLVFAQRTLIFRFLTVFILIVSAILLGIWVHEDPKWVDWQNGFLHLQGDTDIQVDPQKKRILQIMKQLHGATILSGKCEWSYNQAPAAVGFSGNRCYIAWFNQEIQCGHGGEAEYRNKMSNDFFAGTIADPVAFLEQNQISAVLIWPDDAIPDNILEQLKGQLASDYYFIDCKGDGSRNAGIFMPRRKIDFRPVPSLPIGASP